MTREKFRTLACLVLAFVFFTSCAAQDNVHYGRIAGRDIPFTMDFQSKFFGDNTVFCQDIAIASLMVMTRFDWAATSMIQAGSFMETIGFESIRAREIGAVDNDRKMVFMGHKIVEYGGCERVVILVWIPGVYGVHGWLSNFDIGADTPEYFELTGSEHPEWINRYNHKGFDVTANRIIVDIRNYMRTIRSDAQPVLWITGFSRGGSIASIVGAYFEKDPEIISFTYAFANGPLTEYPNAYRYQTIFNIINEDDRAAFLLSMWGFTRFGTDIAASVFDYGQEAFRRLTGIDYTLRANHHENIDLLTRKVVEIAPNRVPNREDLYVFDYNIFFVSENFSTRDEAEAERRRMDRNLRREHRQFAKFYIYELPNNEGYVVVHYQIPAFVLVSFAAQVAAERAGRSEPLPYIADQFAEFPGAFFEAFDLGLPHSPAAHYLIITDLLPYALSRD